MFYSFLLASFITNANTQPNPCINDGNCTLAYNSEAYRCNLTTSTCQHYGCKSRQDCKSYSKPLCNTYTGECIVCFDDNDCQTEFNGFYGTGSLCKTNTTTGSTYCTFGSDIDDICNFDDDCESGYECITITNHTGCETDIDQCQTNDDCDYPNIYPCQSINGVKSCTSNQTGCETNRDCIVGYPCQTAGDTNLRFCSSDTDACGSDNDCTYDIYDKCIIDSSIRRCVAMSNDPDTKDNDSDIVVPTSNPSPSPTGVVAALPSDVGPYNVIISNIIISAILSWI